MSFNGVFWHKTGRGHITTIEDWQVYISLFKPHVERLDSDTLFKISVYTHSRYGHRTLGT